MPFWGTCMGMIVAAHDVADIAQPTLDLLDVTVRRNAFGRQVDSAEVPLAIPALGDEPFPAIFIRAPWIERTGPDVETLAERGGHGVMVRQRNVLGTSFHPELTGRRPGPRLFPEDDLTAAGAPAVRGERPGEGANGPACRRPAPALKGSGQPIGTTLAVRSRAAPCRSPEARHSSGSLLAFGWAVVTDVLVLNFTYEALNITSFQRAVKLLFSGKAEMVHRRDDVIKSTSLEMKLPSIIRMLYYIKRPMQKVALTKKNVLLRDDYTCQYCQLKGERMMTVDHVLPKSKGGPSTWENLVCACMRCNNRKNNRTPEHANMKLKRKPKAPKYIPWIRVKRNTLPGEWHQFLFLYNVSIEERVEV